MKIQHLLPVLGILLNTSVLAAQESGDIPLNKFLCPITLAIMEDPVVAADGVSYERTAILKHF